MRLSVWQQFSSNHSSYFAVVGHFKTVEAAQAVEHELLEWMDRITAVWEFNRKTNPSAEKTLTVPEAELVAKYKLAWYENGMHWNGIPEKSNVIVRVQNDVFFICPVETWDEWTPFVELLEKLGASHVVHGQGEPYELYAYLTCHAPDEEKVHSFVDDMNLNFMPVLSEISLTWVHDENSHYPANTTCEIRTEGQEIRLHVQSRYLARFLSMFVEFVEQNGFTNIDYEISSQSLAGRFEA